MDIADLRKSYERDALDETASAADPLRQFQTWFEQALSSQLPEANAMTLATVGDDGRPSTRVVLIKGFDERGIVWYTNYNSRKGHELAQRPFAALQFHWVELERVVRIEGRVEKTSDEEADAYFASRPLDSRIGAWASPQSQVISSRAVLVEFPRSGLPAGATAELMRIRASGLVPVIAHPERYRGITLADVEAWREVGVVIQGDALMLLSAGEMAQLARAMLAGGLYDVLASDNHGDRRSLATVREWLRETGEDGHGVLLTEENPRRVLADEALLPVPPLRRERSLWQRLRAMIGGR